MIMLQHFSKSTIFANLKTGSRFSGWGSQALSYRNSNLHRSKVNLCRILYNFAKEQGDITGFCRVLPNDRKKSITKKYLF